MHKLILSSFVTLLMATHRSVKQCKEGGNNGVGHQEAPGSSKNQEYLNPINILGIPSSANRRANHERSVLDTNTSNKLNFKILKSSGRCGMGSLLNLNKIPSSSRKVQRSNSARESMLTGRELSMLGGGLLNNTNNIHQQRTIHDEPEREQVGNYVNIWSQSFDLKYC